MIEMIEQSVIDSLNNHDYLTVIFLFLILVLYRFRNIYDFFQIHKSSKINQYSHFLEIKDISEETKDFLTDCIEKEIFKISTNIECNRNLRKLIMKYYNESSGDLNFRHFLHAQRFLSVDNDKLIVKISLIDRIQHWLYFIVSVIVLIITMKIVGTISHSADLTVGQKLMAIFASMIGYMVAAFMLYLAFPISAAKKIQKHINTSGK